MTYFGSFKRVDQTALADVGKANDADGYALRRARFVGLEEAEQCRGCARRQVHALVRTRRAECERRSCVAEVFEPCLGILARHQVYITTIQSKIQMKRKNGAYAPILLSTKTRRLPSASRLLTSSSTSRLRHPAGSRASSTSTMTSASSMTLCSMRI